MDESLVVAAGGGYELIAVGATSVEPRHPLGNGAPRQRRGFGGTSPGPEIRCANFLDFI